MLRRRILASAMASVMALGSVAVVANAEETAVATTQVKTKADLEAYVKSFDKFREDGLNDYGSASGEKFMDAIEYAENVIAESKSTVDDFTVAYSMVEATYKALKIYTAEELKALIDTNKKNYESGNVYNEELGDPIFKEGGYQTFETAYEEAERVLGSSDSRVITDAYEALDGAVNGLSRYPVVTKSQFRTALKDYEAMLQKQYAYESWRVGTMSGDWVNLTTLNEDGSGAGYWGYQNQSIAYGLLYDHLAAANGDIKEAYEEMDEIKSLKQTSLTSIVTGYYAAVNAVLVMNAWKADDTNRASKANVQKLLDEYHGRLVYDYATTSAEDLYTAVVETVTAAGGTVKVLADINDGQATEWQESTAASTPWNKGEYEVKVDPDGDGTGKTVDKLANAGINVKVSTPVYIPLDNNGYWRVVDGAYVAPTTSKPDGKYKLLTKNVDFDLTEFVAVSSADVDDGGFADNNSVLDGDVVDHTTWFESAERVGKWGASQFTKQAGDMYVAWDSNANRAVTTAALDLLRTDLQTAMKLAEDYIAGNYKTSDIHYVDTTSSIVVGSEKGSSAEWTLVYRYLKYALSDKYNASQDLYTKSDVEKLIEDSYALAEATGDAALFSVNHNKLVAARQAALDWVKAANKDKKYKDNVTSYLGGLTSTDAYKDLKSEYDNLKNDLDAFKYSFEEIANKIADTKSAIDEGELQATDELLAALENTAYALSVTKAFTELTNAVDNDAFTADRYFQGFNRVFTSTDDYKLAVATTENGAKITTTIPKPGNSAITKTHKDLTDAYEALVAAVKAQTEKTAVLGDVNGDGVVNALDASAILKAVVAGTEIDVKVGDYNADGTVNALDASAILKFVVSQG